MAKRIVIGMPFNYDENWIGGVYYIQNLISSMCLLPPDKQPIIYLISHEKKSYNYIVENTSYKYLSWIKPAQIAGINGGTSRKIKILQKIIPKFAKKNIKFDVIYPYPIDKYCKQTVCWIPDLQQKYLPELFNDAELKSRDEQIKYYYKNFNHIVFSSYAAKSDFDRFYPNSKCKAHVVHFATFTPPNIDMLESDIKKKYSLPERFFYCPNQFWVHKNHNIVVDAVHILNKIGIKVYVVFSGKEHDHRAPDYTKNLKVKVKKLGLESQILFLGFLPRNEQSMIFKMSIAIIQPSLFEGWSTVIEDAKAISQYVIASDLLVNREQIKNNVEFFDPRISDSLATILKEYVNKDPIKTVQPYKKNQINFAVDFMNVVEEVANDKDEC